MLIAGLYAQEEDPYSPPVTDPYQILGPARGSVRALTYREFTVEVGAREAQETPAGEPRRQVSLSLFGVAIPLSLGGEPEGLFRSWRRESAWAPLGRELPLKWVEKFSQPLQREERPLSGEELKEAALLALRREQRAQLPEGSRVGKGGIGLPGGRNRMCPAGPVPLRGGDRPGPGDPGQLAQEVQKFLASIHRVFP